MDSHSLTWLQTARGTKPAWIHKPDTRHNSNNVTTRSRGYGDVTTTYIRRSKIPSHIYAKHQYRQ